MTALLEQERSPGTAAEGTFTLSRKVWIELMRRKAGTGSVRGGEVSRTKRASESCLSHRFCRPARPAVGPPRPCWRLVACPATSSIGDYNQRIIDEFRANGGRPPSWGGSSPLLLLHHRGATSEVQRVNPVAYLDDDGRYAVFASKAGAPTNPGWYHNLKAHPDTTIEVGSETLEVTAAEVNGEE